MHKFPFISYKLLLIINLFFLCSSFVEAKRPEYNLSLQNHLFYPANIIFPANTKVKLVIFNFDSSVEEFDSFDLNREKVIFPNKKATIFIGPLPEGEYHFFGEYHPHSARGKIIVKSENHSSVSPEALTSKQGEKHAH